MVYTIILWVFSVLFCYTMLSSYKSGESFKPVFTLKNERLARLLIDGHMPLRQKKSSEEDRMRLSSFGLAGYILNGITPILLIVFAFVPDIPCKSYFYFTVMPFVDTFNEIIPLMFALLAFLIESFFISVKGICLIIKEEYRRGLKIALISVFFLIAIMIIVTAMLLIVSFSMLIG